MPPTTTGASTPSLAQQPHDLGHQLEVAAREDRQADHVDVLVAGDGRDLLGRQADALVDDLHAGVAGGHGDLLGAVGVAVEAGLGHQEPGRPARHAPAPARPRRRRPSAPPAAPAAAATPVGARYSPNTSRSTPAHSPVVPPAWARSMVAGMTFSPVVGHPAQLVERALHRVVVAAATATSATSAIICVLHARGRPCRMLSSPPSGDGGGLGEGVDADDLQVAGLDAPHPLGVAAHQPALQLVDGLEGAAQREHVVELGLGRLDQLGRLGLDHRASRRRCRRTRAGRSRRPAPAGCAATTAGPTGGAGRAPRSTPAAGSTGPGRASTA